MGTFLAITLVVITLLLCLRAFYDLLPKAPKFKTGDILELKVSYDNLEEWEKDIKVMIKIYEVGKRSYRIKYIDPAIPELEAYCELISKEIYWIDRIYQKTVATNMGLHLVK